MSDDKTIIRVEKNSDNPFVMIDKRPLEKPYLSWKAKGLLAYLLSRPDNWKVRLGDLVKRSTDGEHATRSALDELKAVKHLKVDKVRAEDGTFEWIYTVFEQPYSDFPCMDNPDMENRDVNNNDCNKKDNTKEKSSQKKKPPEKKGDWIDGLLSLHDPNVEKEIDAVEDMLTRLERELRVNLKRSGKNQTIAKRLIKEEKEGRTLDVFSRWLSADEWRRAHTSMYADLERLWSHWPQAFSTVQSGKQWREL